MTLRASLALLAAATVAGWLVFPACQRKPSEIPLGGGGLSETRIAQPPHRRAAARTAAREPAEAGSAAASTIADSGARKKRDATSDAGRRDASARSDAGPGSKER